jgi:glycosyltransferase involved in cell wall biosynthesis
MPTNVDRDRGSSSPSVSVIVPMKDAEGTISETLEALAAQDYTDFEVLVVDNGSTDASADIVRSFQAALPGLRLVWAAGSAGPAHARNAGAAQATGDLLAFCDADDIPRRDWLRSLADASNGTDAVGGRLAGFDADKLTQQGVQSRGLPRMMGYLPWSGSGNLLVPKEVFLELSGFDENLPICEDVDFSWRLQQAGFALRYCPNAVVRYRSRSGVISNAKRCFAYAVGDVLIYKRHSHHGARRRSIAGAFRAWTVLILTLPMAFHRSSQSRYLNFAARNFGWLVGSFKYQTFYP